MFPFSNNVYLGPLSIPCYQIREKYHNDDRLPVQKVHFKKNNESHLSHKEVNYSIKNVLKKRALREG